MTLTPSTRSHRIGVVGSIILSTFIANGFIPRPNSGRSCSSIALQGSSDRAHFERKFEDMMDNDWRAFRAKLVAQEAQGGIPVVATSSHNSHHHHSSTQQSSHHNQQQQQHAHEDLALQRQSQLGDIFAKSIISIFESGTNHVPIIKKKQQQQASKSSNRRVLYKDVSIFSGESVGTPTANGHQQQHMQAQPHPQTHPSLTYSYEDPFVSAAELPLFLRETKINKHRWAHEIPHVEPGCVLIANEKLGGVFHQTVVLIIQHCDHSGSIGIVINRPLEGDLFKVATEKKSNLDLSLKLAFGPSPVTYGGPVLPEEYSILHGFGAVEGAKKLCPGVFVGGSEDLMNEVRINRMDPRKALFVQGHAAWVPGQLSKEISKGVWYIAAASADLLLRYAGATITEEDNPKDLWADIMTCMGGRYSEIARMHQGQGDKRMP